MIGQELRPGLRRWTSWHEEWKQDVGSVAFEGEGALCLIDPLVTSKSATFPKSPPLHVLVTVYWHTRSAGEIVRRHKGTLWAPSGARAAIARRAGMEPTTFRPGDQLPGGIEAFPSGHGSEVVYWLPSVRTLVVGDAVLGAEGGALTLCPPSWVGGADKLEKLRATLRPLLDLPIEVVAVSHGEPVLKGARKALEHALAR